MKPSDYIIHAENIRKRAIKYLLDVTERFFQEGKLPTKRYGFFYLRKRQMTPIEFAEYISYGDRTGYLLREMEGYDPCNNELQLAVVLYAAAQRMKWNADVLKERFPGSNTPLALSYVEEMLIQGMSFDEGEDKDFQECFSFMLSIMKRGGAEDVKEWVI